MNILGKLSQRQQRARATLIWGMGLVALLLYAPDARATGLSKDETDPAKIMDAVFARDGGDRVVSRIRMRIGDGRGATRERSLVSRWMSFEGGTRTLLFFESPADVRNTGLLTVDWDSEDREKDQWLYLPSLHRSTRISGGNRASSFVGSDFSFSDLTRQNPKHYQFKMLDPKAKVGDEAAWHIEAVPTQESTKQETGYQKVELWVGKDTLVVLRSKGEMGDNRIKYIQATNLEQIDGIWTARRLTARTMHHDKVASETLLELVEITYGDPSVNEADFQPRRLEKGL